MICPNGHETSDADRFCAVCGAAVLPPSRQAPVAYGAPRGTPSWVLPTAIVVGLVGLVSIVVAVVLVSSDPGEETVTRRDVVDSRDDEDDDDDGTTTSSSSSTSTSTSTSTTSTTVPVPPPVPRLQPQPVPQGDCAADVRASSGDEAARTVRRYTTSGYNVSICYAAGGYWYYGNSRSDPGNDIALPATVSGSGYRAVTGDVVYTVDSSWLRVYDGGEEILEEMVLATS